MNGTVEKDRGEEEGWEERERDGEGGGCHYRRREEHETRPR